MNGYVIIGFENPQFLIDYICEHPEHLKFILIDYRMPKMTGCKLAIRIHKITPNIQMAFITAYNDIINNELKLEVIKKPIQSLKL